MVVDSVATPKEEEEEEEEEEGEGGKEQEEDFGGNRPPYCNCNALTCSCSEPSLENADDIDIFAQSQSLLKDNIT